MIVLIALLKQRSSENSISVKSDAETS